MVIVGPAQHYGTPNDRAPKGRTLRNSARGNWLGAGRLEWDIMFPVGLNVFGQ